MVIKNARVIDAKSGMDAVLDMKIENGLLKAMERGIIAGEQEKVIDGKGLIAAPGLVDVHVHFREPGQEDKEDIITGAAAAAAGGFTSVVCMANTRPPVDNEKTLAEVLKRGRQTGIHVYSAAAVTCGLGGKRLTDMEALKAAGAAGFTDDGIPLTDVQLVREALRMAARLELPVSFHEEDPALIENNGIHRGAASAHYKIGGSPREAETELVRRDLKLARDTGAHLNIQHISAAETVALIRAARADNPCIHAEATPHHFSLTEQAAIEFGSMAKMNPPLRTEADRQAIIEGLRDGTIDIIATDHAPHTALEKAKPLTEAPSGIIGLETALALAITNLVKPGYLTLMQLVEKLSYNPAGLYHMDAGYLAPGGPADLVLFDAEEEWKVESFASKSSNSPFIGQTLTGKVKYTICRGAIVYEERGEKDT